MQILRNYLFSKKKYFSFASEFNEFKKVADDRFSINWEDRYPCLNDNTSLTSFDAHYIYHTAWAARVLAITKPKKHVDIGSKLYFSTIASAFIPIDFYDFRPANLKLSNLNSKPGNLMNLPMKDGSVNSLSCMHTIEHIGLGRYGDNLDPQGDIKAIAELKRVLAKNGDLLFVVPVGKQRIQFNAHRIYKYQTIISYFPDYDLKKFSLISDQGKFIEKASEQQADKQVYGCGCFWFRRK